ncbi:hypothetical protein BTM25_09770 [Actinomadura rubteroloni]|uniref:Uncharacterized protein n=1 Tax=Actinomadura rubteroloni TaxID=1926885 RepID=A0A2P4UNG2_9ACTN|nr:hypothetical protein [Actinomadura rubteroloni]POM26576.1 hypothetical protein BTM25_09770 [Actinomadura rubteroloni]
MNPATARRLLASGALAAGTGLFLTPALGYCLVLMPFGGWLVLPGVVTCAALIGMSAAMLGLVAEELPRVVAPPFRWALLVQFVAALAWLPVAARTPTTGGLLVAGAIVTALTTGALSRVPRVAGAARIGLVLAALLV